jgi:hypothetical protein
VGLKSLKSLNLTNVYPNNKKKKNNNNKVKSKPLELFELAGKNKVSWPLYCTKVIMTSPFLDNAGRSTTSGDDGDDDDDIALFWRNFLTLENTTFEDLPTQ